MKKIVYIISVLFVVMFLFSCHKTDATPRETQASEKTDYTLFAQNLLDSGVFKGDMVKREDGTFKFVFDFDESDFSFFEDYICGAGTDEVFVGKCISEEKANEIYDKLEAYKLGQYKLYSTYAPLEAAKLEEAELAKDGDWVIYVVK